MAPRFSDKAKNSKPGPAENTGVNIDTSNPDLVVVDASSAGPGGIQLKADQNIDTKIIGSLGKDVINGYNGDDFLFGNAGNDDVNGGAGDDQLWGDAFTATPYVPGQGQISTITFDDDYDIGDVLKITLDGTEYTYEITSTGVYNFSAADFKDGSSNPLSGALAAKNITPSWDGPTNVLTLTDSDADATDGSFSVSAAITNADPTPQIVEFDLAADTVADDDGKFTLTLTKDGSSNLVLSTAYTDGSDMQDEVMQAFVTTNAAAILIYTGATSVTYDAATDKLILTGPSDGTDMTLDVGASSGTAYTLQATGGTVETDVLTVVASGTTGSPGSFTFTFDDFDGGTFIVVADGWGGSATATSVATAIAASLVDPSNPGATQFNENYTVSSSGSVVTITAKATGDATDLSITDGSSRWNISQTNTDGTDPTLSDVAGDTINAVEDQDGVTVTAESDPSVNLVQSAADEILPEIFVTLPLEADILTGGSGADIFGLLVDGSTNLLTEGAFDTIKDLDLGGDGDVSADLIALQFDVTETSSVAGIMAAATLEDAVNSLFAADEFFYNESGKAGIFMYDERAYLIVANEAGSEFGTDDVIADVTGYVGTLDTTDFIDADALLL